MATACSLTDSACRQLKAVTAWRSTSCRHGPRKTIQQARHPRAFLTALPTNGVAKPPASGAPVPLLHGLHGWWPELLHGRHVAVLWDIENVKPWSPLLTIPVQVHRIQRAFDALGSCGVTIKTAINPSNRQRLAASGVLELLLASGVHIHLCSGFLDAADVELQSHALAFAREHRPRRSGAIAVISNDAGFCDTLRYCSSLGCTTVSMAPHHFRRTAAALPGPPLHKAALPGACHLALMWQQLPGSAMTHEEQAWLQDCLQRCQLGDDGLYVVPDQPASSASAEGGEAHGRRLLRGSQAGCDAIGRAARAAQRLPSWPSLHSPGSVSHAWSNAEVMARYPP